MDAVKAGKLIAQIRKERELTQRDLAEGLHVSVQAVSKWERGLSCPDIALLEPLAEALGLTVTELLSGQRGEEPKEEVVRDSLRFGLAQFRPRLRRWKWLFFLAAALLLALVLWLGYVWLRNNTELFPQRTTVVRGLDTTKRESTLTQAAGKTAGFLYQMDFADDVTLCSFQWELWTHKGLEKTWDAGEQERYHEGRHKLAAITFSNQWHSTDFNYGITLEAPAGVARLGLNGTLEIPYMGDSYAISSLTQRTAVGPEEGVTLLALTLNSEGKLYTRDVADASSGHVARLPEDEQTAHLLLKLFCK